MLDLEQLQVLAQLSDNLDILLNVLEKSYNNKDSENFNRSKNEVLETYKKISEILR